jgi:hypothetical protein
VFGTKRKSGAATSNLKPFVLKLRYGYLLGAAVDPDKGAPCAGCYSKWLTQRNVWNEPCALDDLLVRRELVAELLSENSAHICYEIAFDGTSTRLDNLVFPHPDCNCDKQNYQVNTSLNKSTNFAFSPIFEIKSARFGTPDGNQWLTSATGEALMSREKKTGYGVDANKEASRQKAVAEWLKQSVAVDLPVRLQFGENLSSEVLPSGMHGILQKSSLNVGEVTTGAGASREEAILDALVEMAKKETLQKYSATGKNPMLVVGANNWIRTQVPFFLLQQYDLHLLFYPNAMQAWVVGLAAFSRQKVEAKPIFCFAADVDMVTALKKVLGQILKICQPGEWIEPVSAGEDPDQALKNARLNLWWTHWIYRCSKVSLKDLLHLEKYAGLLDDWRNYFRDGQEPVTVVNLNSSGLPTKLKYLVGVYRPESSQVLPRRNVRGIGTWANFRDNL